MKFALKGLLAAAVIASSATAVQAADISFGGGSINNYSSAWNFNDGAGINVTVTTPSSGNVSWMTNGVGVGSNGFNQDFKGGEKLTFTFDQAVTLEGIDFINWEGPDDAAIFEIDGTAQSLTYSASNDKWMFSSAIELTSFTLTNNGSSWTSIYRVQGLLGVAAAPSEVPVPAAAWLFGSALVGLGGLARRKR